MWTFEINGNLSGQKGLENYELFQNTIVKVYSYFMKRIVCKFPDGPELYIDNATENSGYTPITTVAFKKYIIIKLGIDSDATSSKIAFQFAHELMHYVFYIKYGLGKGKEGDREESICTAASLIYLHETDYSSFILYYNYVKTLEYVGYKNGALIAEQVGYDFGKLVELI